jgi:enediyne biosynthesis protein E4
MKIDSQILPGNILIRGIFFNILLLMIVSLLSCNTKESKKNSNLTTGNISQIFTLLESERTGVDFVNKVIDGEKFNIFTYRNYYNGGGVAIGDINNDGLPDLYFTANHQKNKLYLNKGNFVFEDITEKAGVAGTKAWSTGVTMADVNNDELLDIYVCNSGDVTPEDRKNELFINNGDLTFSEKAKEYNLDNDGYSTHAAFFDYDQDGDLDCFILNNSFTDPTKIELYKKVREIASAGGDKLMRNDSVIFRDVTTEASIFSSVIGFGNGIAIADLNNDNLPDIYIANDFWERDYLYINKGNGKFSEELINRINYCSTSSMGGDIADINNDGNMDIFTTDMLPANNYRLQTTILFDPYHLEDFKYRENFHYQITQNCLHLNDGSGNFQEIGQFSGVDATDWSWGALIFDFENDGMKDIFISNGILRDIMYNDFLDFIINREKREEVIANTGRFDYRNFIKYMPSTPLKNYAFQNTGHLVYQNRADQLGLGEPSFSNGAAYGDLDNDGDLDLVINNENSPSFIYRNESNSISGNHFLKVKFNGSEHNLFGIGAWVTIKMNGEIRVLQNFNSRGFESSTEPNLLFGLGKAENIDELKVTWPDGKVQVLTNIKPDKTIILNYAQASETQTKAEKKPASEFEEISRQVIFGDARHTENRYNDFDQEILLLRALSTEGPRLIKGDVNNDKLDDFILLGAAGDTDKLFLQTANGNFILKENPSFIKDRGFESTCGAFIDQDGDGDLDLLIGSGGNDVQVDQLSYIVRFYKNDGRGNFTADPYHIPPVIGNFSTLETEDFDRDGNMEVFLGARCVPGNYGLIPQSYLLKNDNGNWLDMAPASLGNIGMVTDAAWADVDSDGNKDLVVVGDWMAIFIFKNENGVLKDPIIIPQSNGWWQRIEAADLDKDGDTDFILGNWGLNTKLKASPERPLTMYVNDFDNNGKSEFIINWYPPLDNHAYPFAQKNELVAQLPVLRNTILTYKDYADQTYDSLFKPEIREKSIRYETDYMESAVLWNEGNSFILKALPPEAQVSPVFGIVADDLDGDENPDIWLGGNFYSLKPQVGRHDASRGVFLKGGPDRSFTYQQQPHDGLYVKGEVRDASIIYSRQSKRIIVARNNDKVLLFQKRKNY